MNVLIIGGSGGLSGVVAKMAMEQYRVWTLTRGIREVPHGVTALQADRNDLQHVKKLLAEQNVRWDVVIDCICMNREQAEADLAILPEFTDRLIVVSTDSVYDGRYKKIPEREDGICVKEPDNTGECSYAGNKRHMEEAFIADINSGESGLKITIFRPGHIYGPGFLPGCFPEHSRQKELPDLILQGKPIRLVGMGIYVIHPIFVDDLARILIDCVQKEKTYGEIFCVGGPEAIENKTYYEKIAECLGTDVRIEEIPLKGYLEKHPEYSGHLCHRVYDLSKLREAGVIMPTVGIREGMEKTLLSMGYQVKGYNFYGWEQNED
ncbi:MAG: NAD-dependent epimerase/dehydratase family protein [Lachnospiraceae bacterium]|nr:NAD-dependent epimerase/dehydratase family protein [Lachnospiraceae bacterium]